MRKVSLKGVRVSAVLGVMAMLVALAGGCGGPSRPAPPPSEEVTPPAEKPTSPAEEGELIRLKCQVPCEYIKGEPLPEEIRWINSELEERSSGGLKLEIDWGKSDTQAIRTFVVDTGILTVYGAEVNPFQAAACVSSLRFAGLETGESAGAYMQLLRKFPEAQQEVEIRVNQRWLAVYDVPACGLLSTKEITSIEDMNGLKVRPSTVAECYEAIGADAIFMMSVEVPLGLGLGVIDAAEAPPSQVAKWGYMKYDLEQHKNMYQKYCDARKCFISRTLAGSAPLYAWTINMDVFNELPSEYQEALVDVGKESTERYPAILRDAEAMSLEKLVKEQGVNVVELTPEEIAEWQFRVSCRALYEDYVRKVEDMGFANAREVLDGYCELLNFKP